MKTFEYRGFDGAGRAVRGLVEALDPKSAREKLSNEGVLAESLQQAGSRRAGWLANRKVRLSSDTRAAFYREISALLKAGLPLAGALEVLIESPELGDGRAVLARVRDAIREGSSLAAALDAAGAGVTPFERAATEVGERSGELGQSLEGLATFMDEQQRLRDRVQAALIYPSIVVALAIVIALVMLGVILPQFAKLLADTRIALPAVTRWTLRGGRVLSAMALPTAIVLIAGCVVLRRALSRDADLRMRVDRRLFGLPLWGKGYASLVSVRFARTLALLLRGGVPLVEGIVLAGRASGSAWVEGLARKEADAVRHGSALADAMRRIPPLGGSLPGWVQAGEAGGDLAGLLESAGRQCQQRWERMVTRFVAILEPVLIVLVGSVVLMLALALLMPVLSLNQSLI